MEEELKTIEQQLQDIIDLLTRSLPDAAKADSGVKAAATRVRKSLMSSKTQAHQLRAEISRRINENE